MKFQDVDIYVIFNSLMWIIIFAICLILLILFVGNIIARIILAIVSFVICGFIEERILSKYVNRFVKKIILKSEK